MAKAWKYDCPVEIRCQFATLANADSKSPRRAACMNSGCVRSHNATTEINTTDAGSRRRARLDQKPGMLIRPLRSRSITNNVVMR